MGDISMEWRKLMKKECGGLQTLLKNNKQLFVVEKGIIRIRDWRENSPEDWTPNPELYKTRICNFIQLHPHGCPRKAENCPFAHTEDEKRDNVIPSKKRKM